MHHTITERSFSEIAESNGRMASVDVWHPSLHRLGQRSSASGTATVMAVHSTTSGSHPLAPV